MVERETGWKSKWGPPVQEWGSPKEQPLELTWL